MRHVTYWRRVGEARRKRLSNFLASDEELMAAYVAGVGSAFGEIVRRHAPTLKQFMVRGLYSRQDAEDLVQQTFLLVHRARLDFDMQQRVIPWLFTVGLNVKREYLRSKRRSQEVMGEIDETERCAESWGSGSDRFEAIYDIHHALSLLPPANREVIELHWFCGLSFPEVAQVLGVTTTAVKVRAHRSYIRLRKLLTGQRNLRLLRPREPAR